MERWARQAPWRLSGSFIVELMSGPAWDIELGNENLHGSAPDKCRAALLLIDVINAFDFPEGPMLLKHALPMAERIAELKVEAKKLGIPAVYVNDNFGRWRSDFRAYVDHCLENDVVGRPIVEKLRPEKDDYFVLKPKHSGFYSTTLDTLLEYLGVETVVLTGIASNICVLFTANDAYMRDLKLIVPSDCVAANTKEDNEHALQQMANVLKADVRPSGKIRLDELAGDITDSPPESRRRHQAKHG
jgi:nicotinamidase-related amidase